MNDTILKADNLYFSYDNDKSHSLNGLSLEIKRGTKVALMGANGSGKSTFFLCCNGIHKPSGGTLCFNGQPVDYSKKGLLELRSKVGIVFQDPDDQLFSASVSQEISFGILNLGLSEEKAKKASVLRCRMCKHWGAIDYWGHPINRDFGDNRSCVFFKTKNGKYYRCHRASQLACKHFERKEE